MDRADSRQLDGNAKEIQGWGGGNGPLIDTIL
jgi:hypothetical protein